MSQAQVPDWSRESSDPPRDQEIRITHWSAICTRAQAPAGAGARPPPLGIHSPGIGAALGCEPSECLSLLGFGMSSGAADRKNTLDREGCPPQIAPKSRVS